LNEAAIAVQSDRVPPSKRQQQQQLQRQQCGGNWRATRTNELSTYDRWDRVLNGKLSTLNALLLECDDSLADSVPQARARVGSIQVTDEDCDVMAERVAEVVTDVLTELVIELVADVVADEVTDVVTLVDAVADCKVFSVLE
jgi:hypothetical protein